MRGRSVIFKSVQILRPRIILPFAALLLALFMPLNQGHAAQDDELTAETLREDLQSLRDELADANAEQQNDLMADIESVLGSVEGRIEVLESRLQENWNTADRLARVQAQTAVASLRRERARATEWFMRMQDSSNLTWESMKDSFNDTFDEMSDAWQDAETNVSKAVEDD